MKLLFLAAILSTATLIAQTPSGDAANGKRLFVKDGCYECHGYAGQGGFAGARIADIELKAKGLIAYVRAPAGQMPAYKEKVISDRELTDIWAYLESLPKAKPAKDIPLLNALQR
jgi:mono/diheme cytochrome c family protein